MTKIKQTPEELNKHLQEQLKFLINSVEAYDRGEISEAKRMAVTIRILLHDTSSSISLLKQLQIKDTTLFFDTIANEEIELPANTQRIGGYCGLVCLRLGSSTGYSAFLDDVHKKKTDYVDFDTYWNKIIILDKEGNTFTRKQIIDAIANQDGGAHVDPELKKEYVDFSRKNSMGWVHSIDDKNWNPVMGAELASVRQIAHEILRTLIPSYPIKKMVCSEIAGPTISTDMKAVYADDILLTEVTKKVGRNELCPCKSGVKYKECCGK